METATELRAAADRRASRPILVTGATGYIGGRLVPRLLEAGYPVRCLARCPRKLADHPWAADPRVEIQPGDLADAGSLAAALDGCEAAFYLVHSMVTGGPADTARDRDLARSFAEAAARASLRRIVYLGGLGELGAGPGTPLAGRPEVARCLAVGATPVTVLRAPLILGSGSASFEMLRGLVERLPVMVAPRWVSFLCQPIAVRNVLEYLVACLAVPAAEGLTLDIGGPDVLSYRQLMDIMAEELGLRRRLVIPLPVQALRLSARWVHLITPVGLRVARALVEALRAPLLCREHDARRLMPGRLLPAREAIRLALARVQERRVTTAWSAAGPIPGDAGWSAGPVLESACSCELDAPPAVLYRALCRMGGANGWLAANWLWRLRGALDRLAGGPGLRRGRRHPDELRFGEAVDFWRVVGLEADRLLTLRGEMKVPGVAELEFAIEPRDTRGGPLPPGTGGPAPRSRLTQTARFRPRGLAGWAYWYTMLPLHGILFRRMLRAIKVAAERPAGGTRQALP